MLSLYSIYVSNVTVACGGIILNILYCMQALLVLEKLISRSQSPLSQRFPCFASVQSVTTKVEPCYVWTPQEERHITDVR